MDNLIKEQVIELLEQLPVYLPNSDRTQHVVRCPYCGDSQDPTHGHFSIKIDVDSDEPMLYRCFKCPAAGLLTSTVLSELEISVDSEIDSKLRAYNRKLVKSNKHLESKNNKYVVPVCEPSKICDVKLEYINSRLGTSIDYHEASQLKIVLDLFTFIKFNEIESIPGVSFKLMNFINYNYVGFLSTNNNCITFRRINDDDSMMRYQKIILKRQNVNSNTFYSIPNHIDELYTHDINIHIAEGTFDILSIYKNLEKSNLTNNYFYAACGFGYLSILEYLVSNCVCTGLNIHIYSDSDKSNENHIQYLFGKKNMDVWMDHIFIHRNILPRQPDEMAKYDKYGKAKPIKRDYGVPLSKIQDSIIKIK